MRRVLTAAVCAALMAALLPLPVLAAQDQSILFDTTAAAPVVGATYDVAATATSGLPVTFTIDAASGSACTILDATVTFVHAGSCVIDADQAGDIDWNPAPTVQQEVVVGQASQAITFTSTAPVGAAVGGTYDVTATATSGLPVTFTIAPASAAVCTISAATVSFTGVGTCTIEANQAGDADWAAAPQDTQGFTVAAYGSTPQVITFGVLGGRTYGDAPFTVSATGGASGNPVVLTSQTTGMCTVSGTTVTVVAAGGCTIRATQDGNATYAPAAPVDRSFTVAKATLVVTAQNKAITFGDPDPAFTFAYGTFVGTDDAGDIDTPPTCTVSGAHAGVAGSPYPITCSGGLDNDYAFGYVAGALTVGQASQAITFTSTAPVGAAVGGTYDVTATATSGLPVTFTIAPASAAVCTISAATVSFTGVGTCTIEANQAGDADWAAAPQATQGFTVAAYGSTPQVIAFGALGDRTYGDAPFTASATGGASGNPVVLTSQTTGMCTVSGTTVTVVAAGGCTIRATQDGNATYAPAAPVDRSFTVAKATLVVTAQNKAITFGDPDPAFTFAYGTFVGTDDAGDIDTPPTCTVSGAHAGVAGSPYPITCSGGLDNDYAFSYVAGALTVGQASQAITFTSTAPVGAAVGGTYDVTATATSGLPVTFTIAPASAAVCTISAATVSFTDVGTCTIEANQAGDADWAAAPQATQGFTVAAYGSTPQVITFGALGDRTYGDAPFTASATGGASGNPVVLTSQTTGVCTVSGTTVTVVAAGGCTIRATQDGNATYAPAAPVDRSFTVAKATLVVTAQNKAITFGDPDPAFTFAYGTFVGTDDAGDIDTPPTCTVSGAHAGVAGSPYPITCSGGLDNDYAFGYVAGALTVGQASQAITFTSTVPVGAAVGGTYDVTATATSGLPVTFTIAPASAAVCTISRLAGQLPGPR